MQFIMNNEGFKAKGNISFESKEKIFQITCEPSFDYKFAGELDIKKYKDLFNRYLAVCGRELAKVWLKKEPNAIKAVQKKLDKAESDFKKRAKKLKSQQEIIDLANSLQVALQAASEKLMKEKLGIAGDDTGKVSHEAAMKAIAKEAKGVLKSKKSIAYKIVIGVGKFVLAVVAVAVAALAVVVTGGAAIVIGIAVGIIVVKAIMALINAYKSAKSVRKDLRNNFEAYADSVVKLEDQIQETIKLSRGLTSNWDRLHLQQASAMGELKKIADNIPADADDNKDAKKIMKLRKQIENDGSAINKILNYKPAEIEKSLINARKLIPTAADVNKVSKRLDAADTWFSRLGQWAGGAKNILKLAP